ncbi:Non-specific phospholipase C2, partial [Cucurbita argyrosperma subsp. argyrosperma]
MDTSDEHCNGGQIHSFFLLLLAFYTPLLHGSSVKTIIVLIMENCFFDHMLGWMKKLNLKINGVDGTESNFLNASDQKLKQFLFKDQAHYVDPDPVQSFQVIREKILGSDNTSANPPRMNRFAQKAFSMDNTAAMSADVMNEFQPDLVVVYKSLVSVFAVFDRSGNCNYQSISLIVNENRNVQTDFIGGLHRHRPQRCRIGSTFTQEPPLEPRVTFRHSLAKAIHSERYDAGTSFGIYFQNLPSTLAYGNLRKLKYLNKFHLFDLDFKRHANQGKLPNYVVLEPQYFNLPLELGHDDHPSHDVYQGQMLIKEVYETLRSSPQWNETLFIITYDEHGGFYDHVPMPVTDVPSPDGIVEPKLFLFRFDRLGIRVSTIMISPWIEKGPMSSLAHYPMFGSDTICNNSSPPLADIV